MGREGMRKKLFIGTVAAGLSFIVFIALAQTFPVGMISYWKAEGNALDTVGDHHGFFNRPVFTSGKVGQAFSFVDSTVSVPDSPNLDLADAITVMAWVKPKRAPGPNDYNSYDRVISKGGLATAAAWSIWFAKNALTPNFIIGIPGYGGLTMNCPMIGTIPSREWTHIVGTYDRQKIKIYIDGMLNNKVDHDDPIRQDLSPLYIGSAGNRYYFWGDIDEVAIYDRALTSVEIYCHYQNGLNGLGYEAFRVAFVDIKPGSCPNPLNIKNNGVLPVAILGTEFFDVSAIDPATLRLAREGYEDDGILPLRWSLEDVATPYRGTSGGCNDLGGDGYLDLALKFDTREVVQALDLDAADIAGETLPLMIIGRILEERGGAFFAGSDVVSIPKKGK